MYALKNTHEGLKLFKIKEIVKQSSKGISSWVVFEGMKKCKIVSNNKIFETKEEAELYLKERNEKKVEKWYNKQKRFEKEQKQIDEIMDNIFKSFGVTVKFLSKPCSVEDAWNLYYKIKQDKNIRDIEIY